jgi:hypothetical protein
VTNVTVAAFKSAEGFASGGNLALQIINNNDDEATVPITVDNIAQVNNATAYLVNNDYDLAEQTEDLLKYDGASLTATVPARSLVVVAIDST